MRWKHHTLQSLETRPDRAPGPLQPLPGRPPAPTVPPGKLPSCPGSTDISSISQFCHRCQPSHNCLVLLLGVRQCPFQLNQGFPKLRARKVVCPACRSKMNNPFLWEGAHPLSPQGAPSHLKVTEAACFTAGTGIGPRLDRVKLDTRVGAPAPPSGSLRHNRSEWCPSDAGRRASQRGWSRSCPETPSWVCTSRPSRSPRPRLRGSRPRRPPHPGSPRRRLAFVISPGPSPLAGLPGAPSPYRSPG